MEMFHGPGLPFQGERLANPLVGELAPGFLERDSRKWKPVAAAVTL
jgi:hypothetical protein